MSQKLNKTNQKFIPLSRPEISNKAIEDVINVLKSGWMATGPLTKKFEEQLSNYFGNRKAICFSSATAALEASLIAIGIKAGDEVITTSMTFAATANVIAKIGAKPIFVDIDPETLNIDINKIESAYTSKTKAIMPVHYAGLSVDLDPIYDFAKSKQIRVIEDAAHAAGSKYKGKKIGSFGDIQVFSFHPIKNMTSGEGGCVLIDPLNTAEIKTLELQRFHGIDRSIWDRFSKKASHYYDVTMPGGKSNMSDIQSAIGLNQLHDLENMNETRRNLANTYRKEMNDLQNHLSFQSNNTGYSFLHSGHLFPICLKDHSKRDSLIDYLKTNNIGAVPYYSPVHLFSYYRNQFGYSNGDLPHTETIGKSIICIPLYTLLTSDEQSYIIRMIKLFFGEN